MLSLVEKVDAEKHWVIPLIIALVTNISVFFFPQYFPFLIIRWFFGIIFLLYLPGYVIFKTLFCKSIKNPFIECTTYSVVLSIALLSFIGMVLNLLKNGLNVVYIIIVYDFLIITFSIIYRINSNKQSFTNSIQHHKYALTNSFKSIKTYFYIILTSSIIIKIPFIVFELQGNKFGGDIATYAYWSKVIDQTNNIPNWLDYMPLEQPSRFAPGIPIFFSVISQVTHIEVIHFTTLFYIFSFILIATSIYLLLEEYLHDERISVLGTLFWVFSARSFTDAIVYSNTEKNWLATGGSPPNVIGFLFIAVLLLSIVKFENSRKSRHIFLIFILATSMMIFHQLSFLILTIGVLIFLITFFKSINLKHLIIFVLFFIALLPLIAPSWLTDTVTQQLLVSQGIDEAIVNKWASITSVKFENLPKFIGYTAVIFTLLGILTELNLIKNRVHDFFKGRSFKNLKKTSFFFGIFLVIVIMISHFGPFIVGIHGARFLYFSSILIMPLMMNGISKFINFFSKRNLVTNLTMNGISKFINFFSINNNRVIFIILFLTFLSIGEGIINIYDLSMQYSQKKYLFSSLEQNAAEYLINEVNIDEVIVADLQKIRDSVWLKPYTMKQVIFHPSMYVIEMTPPPFNGATNNVHEIFSSPNLSIIVQGFKLYNFTFYWFEKPYNQREIEVFNLLSICTKIYENAEVIIFKIDISNLNDEDIIQAENYYEISSDIKIGRKPEAFGQYIGSKSTDESFDGNFCVYSTHISEEGNYDLFLSRYVYHTEEYIEVYVDDIYQGIISFNQTGWQLGNLSGIKLTVDQHLIKFVFKETVRYCDGMDYFILKNRS